MGQRVFGGEVRRRQVEIARGHEELHVGILGQCAAQIVARVRKTFAAATGPPLPGTGDAFAQNVILQVRLVAQFTPHVVVECRRVRRADR